MPPVVRKPVREVYGQWRYRCPKCGAVHHWQASRCHKIGCKYVGLLEKIK